MSDSEPFAYVDTSGLVKLAISEEESSALLRFLAPYAFTCSSLALMEVVRAVLRSDESALGTARAVLARLNLVEPSQSLLRRAGSLLPQTLRTLDAIHIASALSLGNDLDVLVTYDGRMREAAERAGLRVESPGLIRP